MDQRSVNKNETLTAVNKSVIIEIINNADAFAEEVGKRTGLIISRNLLQGDPKFGRVISISDDIESPEITIGDRIIFKRQELFQGFKLGEISAASIPYKDIVGKVLNEPLSV